MGVILKTGSGTTFVPAYCQLTGYEHCLWVSTFLQPEDRGLLRCSIWRGMRRQANSPKAHPPGLLLPLPCPPSAYPEICCAARFKCSSYHQEHLDAE